MPKVTIDHHEIEVAPGTTVLEAARAAGIEIPTLCHLGGCEPSTSCFVCVVKVKGRDGLVPSCATVVHDGMHVESGTADVRDARKMALELLLSDHLGDCIGPCHAVCPAHMNIPRMIRQIAAGRLRDAVATVKEHIPLAAVLGRICPAPCEKGCRRGQHDAPISICLLKRLVGDFDLATPDPYQPPRKPATGKRVAIVGAGPAGLSAAWHLLQDGHAVTLHDDRDKLGGMLQYAVPEERLPRGVLDAEAALITRLGVELRLGARVGAVVDLFGSFDAVLIAAGELRPGDAARFGVPASEHGVEADRHTLATPVRGVFAAGGAIRPQKMAVRSVADGKVAAASISQFLAGKPVVGLPRLYSTHIGKLKEGEMPAFLAGASQAPRVEPAGGLAAGFTEAEARDEALRCLHCDCRKPAACRLRRWSDALDASPSRFKADRRLFTQHAQHDLILYEPGKCIRCGLCIQIAAKAGEALGLTFIGRGFDVVVGVPFSQTIADGLKKSASACAAACPTGALALRQGEDPPGTT